MCDDPHVPRPDHRSEKNLPDDPPPDQADGHRHSPPVSPAPVCENRYGCGRGKCSYWQCQCQTAQNTVPFEGNLVDCSYRYPEPDQEAEEPPSVLWGEIKRPRSTPFSEPAGDPSQSGSGSANAQQRYRMKKTSKYVRNVGPAAPALLAPTRTPNPFHQTRRVVRNTNADQASGRPSHFTSRPGRISSRKLWARSARPRPTMIETRATRYSTWLMRLRGTGEKGAEAPADRTPHRTPAGTHFRQLPMIHSCRTSVPS